MDHLEAINTILNILRLEVSDYETPHRYLVQIFNIMDNYYDDKNIAVVVRGYILEEERMGGCIRTMPITGRYLVSRYLVLLDMPGYWLTKESIKTFIKGYIRHECKYKSFNKGLETVLFFYSIDSEEKVDMAMIKKTLR